MNRQDLFMAVLALLLAFLAFAAAIHNRDHYYRLPKVRWIDERWGRKTGRAVYADMGLVLLALAVAILCGWTLLPP